MQHMKTQFITFNVRKNNRLKSATSYLQSSWLTTPAQYLGKEEWKAGHPWFYSCGKPLREGYVCLFPEIVPASHHFFFWWEFSPCRASIGDIWECCRFFGTREVSQPWLTLSEWHESRGCCAWRRCRGTAVPSKILIPAAHLPSKFHGGILKGLEGNEELSSWVVLLSACF